jgi:hypothetical protein
MLVDKREDGLCDADQAVGEYTTRYPAASARTRPSKTASDSGWSATISARAPLKRCQIAGLLGRNVAAAAWASRPNGEGSFAWTSWSLLKFSWLIFSPSSAATSLAH